MSISEPFDAAKIIALWTKLFELQVDLGYYENNNAISFPPPEGRPVDEALCQELHLSEEVITLLKRLPCPRNFDEAWETPIIYESFAIPLAENKWIRESRDPERCRLPEPDKPLRLDYLKPEELALVLFKDQAGHNLILDTKDNTVRFFVASKPPFDPVEGQEDRYSNPDFDTHERPDDPEHHRNHPARPAVEVLEELIAKFRELVWIAVRSDDSGSPAILTAENGLETMDNAYREGKTILQEQFGWPDNFDKEEWNRQRTAIWERLLYPEET